MSHIWIPFLSIFFTSLLVVVTFSEGYFTEDLILVALRRTARLALLFFTIPYISRPLVQIYRSMWTIYLLRYRREFGIAFGFSFLSHIILIVLLIAVQRGQVLPESIGLDDLLIGLPGLILALLMLITSFEKVRRKISAKSWTSIHKWGIHMVWSIFFLCLLSKIVFPKKDFQGLTYYPYLLLLLLILIIRISPLLQKKLRKRSI